MDSYATGARQRASLSSSSSSSPSSASPDGASSYGKPAPPGGPARPATSATGAPASEQRAAAPSSVPAACLACRSKHLKCDGATPCSRCQASDSFCQYIASRRGYKGPRRNTARNPNKRHASDSPPADGGNDSCPMLLGAGVSVSTAPAMVGYHHPVLGLAEPMSPFVATPGMPGAGVDLYRTPPFVSGMGMMAYNQQTQTVAAPSVGDNCLDSFYFHFFPGHPAVLPKPHLLRAAKERRLDHLLAAIRWAGSLYLEVGPSRATMLDEALRLVYAPDVEKDAFLVQALIILIIGLDGSCENDRARDILSDAERIAIEIGLYQRAYAANHSHGDHLLEESLRRTWWDLFVVDGMIAGVHRQTNFLLFDIVADVGLPCEEHQYLSGTIPRPLYLEDFEDQIFSEAEIEFSSFAYRVASIRNLGRMMRLPESVFPGDQNVDKIEALLSNWRMHLPPSKRDCLTKDCQLDEMMFQAHMINHACSIILHQPHSQLDSSPARDVTACAPYQMVRSGENFNTHTKHIITAACAISKMVTYAVPITCHTHFFTCVLTLSSIVHLSKWALYVLQDDDNLRQQIRLNIGALNQLSSVWKAAGRAAGQVKGVAQEIYRSKKAQQSNASMWVGFTQEEIVASVASDESIMSDINIMLQPDP